MKFLHRATAVSAIAVSTCLALGVIAPARAAAQEAELSEIVVTAQGREQSLQDVPVAVSVVSGENLVEQGIATLQDVSTRIGNVKITTGSLVNSINVRGVGSGENPGFEQAVGTFADGVYRSRSRATMSALFDVERLEILKGPQTTFFGANASAGALNIITRKPSRELEYNATALYAVPDGEYSLEAGISGPLSDTLSARVAGRVSGMNGWVKLDRGGHAPNDDSQQARISLRWEPSESWTTDFRFDLARSRVDEFTHFQLLNCPPPAGFPMTPVCGQILGGNPGPLDTRLDFRSSALPSYSNFDFYEAALTNMFEVGPGTIRSTTAWNDMKVDNRVSLVPVDYPTAVGGFDPFPVQSVEKYEFFSQELRYESETGGTLEYMFGGYYSNGKLYYDTLAGFFFLPFGQIVQGAFGAPPPATPIFDATTPLSARPITNQKEHNWSGFASATIRPTDNLRINLGARYTKVRKTAHRSISAGTSVNATYASYAPFTNDLVFAHPLAGPLNRTQAMCLVVGCVVGDYVQTRRTDDKFMPSVGLQYDITPEVMLYGTYSKGFKAGGFSTTSTPSVFGPENVDAYEVGMKGQFLDRRLTLNLSGFRMDYKGLQETTFDANLSSTITNVAGARAEGVEATVSFRAMQGITLWADVGYLDATYRDYPRGECTKAQLVQTAPGVRCFANLAGARRAYAPEWSGSAGIDAEIPMGDNVLRISPAVRFSSRYFLTATADPLFRQGGYAKVDLRLGYGPEDRKWEVALIGRNLNAEITSGYKLGVPGADGSVTALVDRGRSVGLQLSIKN